MRATAATITLLIIKAAFLTTSADDPEAEDLKGILPCDAGTDPIVPYGENEYFICQKTPVAVGQEDSNKGLWIRWSCYEGTTSFDEEKCKPVLEGPMFDPEVKPLMDQLTFCKENEIDGSVPDGLSCAGEYSFQVPDGENIQRFYQCELGNSNSRCGEWHLMICNEQHIFDISTQACNIDETQPEQSRLQLRQAYLPYGAAPAYGYAQPMPAYGYGVPYAAPSVPMYAYPRPIAYAPVQRVQVVPVMPAATVGFPMNPFFSGFGMQNLLQYYMSMFPWMYPGYGGFGMPPRGGQRGGGGGAPPAGGAPGGGAPAGGPPGGAPPSGGPPGGAAPGGGSPGANPPAAGPKEGAPDGEDPGKDKGGKDKGGGLGGALGGLGGKGKLPGLPGAGGLPKLPGMPKLPGIPGFAMIMPLISKILAPIKKLFG